MGYLRVQELVRQGNTGTNFSRSLADGPHNPSQPDFHREEAFASLDLGDMEEEIEKDDGDGEERYLPPQLRPGGRRPRRGAPDDAEAIAKSAEELHQPAQRRGPGRRKKTDDLEWVAADDEELAKREKAHQEASKALHNFPLDGDPADRRILKTAEGTALRALSRKKEEKQMGKEAFRNKINAGKARTMKSKNLQQ